MCAFLMIFFGVKHFFDFFFGGGHFECVNILNESKILEVQIFSGSNKSVVNVFLGVNILVGHYFLRLKFLVGFIRI